jgi:hypothetical protein
MMFVDRVSRAGQRRCKFAWLGRRDIYIYTIGCYCFTSIRRWILSGLLTILWYIARKEIEGVVIVGTCIGLEDQKISKLAMLCST